MNLQARTLISLSLLSVAALTTSPSFAEDWTISAVQGCKTSLGNTIESGGGLKASGGTAVVSCPLTKEVGSDTINFVYARMNRFNAGGADPFCTLSSISNYGTPTSTTWGYATDGAGTKSVSIPMPTQYSSGYANVYCVLNVNDTLYGIRYLQDN